MINPSYYSDNPSSTGGTIVPMDTQTEEETSTLLPSSSLRSTLHDIPTASSSSSISSSSSSSSSSSPSTIPDSASSFPPVQYLSDRFGLSYRSILGVFLLFMVAIIWVSASALTQYLFINLHLQRPFFLTYINTTEFIILLPVRLVWEKYFPNGVRLSSASSTAPIPSTSSVVWFHPGPLTNWKLTFYAALKISPVWFLAQTTYNWSLAGTSVSSSTILSTTSCVFTYILSIFILKESTNWSKSLGITCTVIGALLTGYADELAANSNSNDSSSNSTWWGDSLALFSASMYAIYTTLIQKLIPLDGSISMSSLFGMIGCLNGMVLWPIVILFHNTGIEDLSSVSLFFIGLVLLKGLIDNVLSDILWAKGIQLTNATLATVALSLTIPLAMITDLILHNKIPSLLLLGGSLAVCSGFIFTTLSLSSSSSSSSSSTMANTGTRNLTHSDRSMEPGNNDETITIPTNLTTTTITTSNHHHHHQQTEPQPSLQAERKVSIKGTNDEDNLSGTDDENV